MEGQQGILGAITTPRQVRAMQEGVVKTQSERRKSLSEVKESLDAISTKLDSAEGSWAPWVDVNDAKQAVADIQSIVGQKVEEGQQGGAGARQEVGKLQGA